MLKMIDEKRYSGISTVLESELAQLEDSKKILVKKKMILIIKRNG
jgi:hypothetical protein